MGEGVGGGALWQPVARRLGGGPESDTRLCTCAPTAGANAGSHSTHQTFCRCGGCGKCHPGGPAASGRNFGRQMAGANDTRLLEASRIRTTLGSGKFLQWPQTHDGSCVERPQTRANGCRSRVPSPRLCAEALAAIHGLEMFSTKHVRCWMFDVDSRPGLRLRGWRQGEKLQVEAVEFNSRIN